MWIDLNPDAALLTRTDYQNQVSDQFLTVRDVRLHIASVFCLWVGVAATDIRYL